MSPLMRHASIQTRVLLTLLAIMLPMLTIFTTYRLSAERQRRDVERVERFTALLDANQERVCERARIPKRIARKLKGASTHFYDGSLAHVPQRANKDAPPLTLAQREHMLARSAQDPVHHESVWPLPWVKRRGRRSYTVARFDGEQTRCVYVRILWPTHAPRRLRGLLAIVLPQTIALALLLLLSSLVIAIPLVRRIRRLTEEVESTRGSWRLDDVGSYGGDELGTLARAFDAAGEEIERKVALLVERDLALKEYISHTTHDLAIPLTVIQHRLRRVERAVRQGGEVDMEWIKGALDESHYIASLIANMGALAKLEAASAQTIAQERVDLHALVERVVARHQPLTELAGIELVWSTPEDALFTSGDSALIERALSNLVQNAMQYNDRGGHVAILLDALDDTFSLTVLDDGPGIPSGSLAMLGERAVRGDEARSRNPGGRGFGLSIVQKVCEAHGFEIDLSPAEPHSAMSQGLRVVICGALHSSIG